MLFDNSRISNVDSKNYLFKFIRILKKIFHKERKSKKLLYSMNPDILDCIDAQNGLTESEERLKEVLENQISCSYKRNLITDSYEYFSPVFFKITGYTSEEMINFSMNEALALIHPEDIPEIERVMKESMNNNVKSSYYVEYRFKNKNGSYRWLHDQFTVLKNEEGINVALIGSLSDIDERKKTENILHETLLNLKKSQSIASIGNWKLDISTNKFNSSEEGLRLFGFPSDFNPTFQEVSDYIHPDDLHIASTALKNSLKTGEPYSVEIRVKRKDTGEIRNILSVAEVQFDLNGNPECVIGVNQDITELKRKENTLRQNEQRYKDLIENSGTSIIIIDRDGFYKLVNRKASEQFGTSADRIVGKSIFDFLPHDTAEKYLESNRLLIDSGGHREYEDEYFLNGKLKTFLVVDQCLKDEAGNNFAIQSSSIDISIRKEMEKALIDNEARLRAILDNSRDAIGVYVNGIWEMCNPAAVKLFGVKSASELLGTPILNVITPDERLRIQEYVQQRFSGVDAPKAYITRGLKADGTEFEMEVTLSSYILHDVKYVLVILRDITERIAAEEAIKLSEKKFRSIIDSSPIAYALNDDDGNITYLNSAFVNTFGYTSEDLHIVEDWWPRAYPDPEYRDYVIKSWQANLDEAKREGKSFEPMEVLIHCKDGAVKTVIVSATSIPDQYVGVHLVILYDITERVKADKALKLSEARFKDIFDKHDAVMMLIDPQTGSIIDANRSAVNYYGYNKSKLLSMNIDEINALPIDQVRTERVKAAEEKTNYFIFSHRMANGEQRIVEIHSSPIEYENGKILFSIIHDITERKLAEDLLQQQALQLLKLSNELNIILENAPIGVSKIVDRKQVLVNSKTVELFQYSREEMEFQTTRMLYPSDEAYEKFGLEAYPVLASGIVFETEQQLIRKDGVHIIVQYIGKALDSNDMSKGTIWLLNDITEKKKNEKELEEYRNNLEELVRQRTGELVTINTSLQEYKEHLLEMVEERTKELSQSQETFRVLTENTKDFIAILNSKMQFIFVNKALEELTGIFGKNALELMPSQLNVDKNSINMFTSSLEQVLMNKKRNRVEFQLANQQWVDWLMIPRFEENGEVESIITTGRDVTELKAIHHSLQKNYEREHELNEMKNKFISMVSHEFRTPLTSILASSDFLEMGGDKYDMEKKAKQFARIRRSVDYMLNMLNEVLMINKMDRAKIDITLEIINLSEFCRDVFVEVNQLYPKIKSKIEINLRDRTYNIDTILMKNILGNLISNAFKYNVEKGNVKFLVEDKNGRLIFKITDTGFGIPADEQTKLFEPFSRMSNVKHIKGTGLGMSIIKNSVELLNGEITFVSNENEGTEFIVTIPIVE